MPNQPLIRTPVVVPLYAGLQTEISDKLIQVGSGVLTLENMVASVSGEMSKRDGSTDLTVTTTPTLPLGGGSLPNVYSLSTYRSELVRLSVPGPNPLWSYVANAGSWLSPIDPVSSITSLFRGPIATSLTNLVDSVTVNSSVQTPDIAAVNAYGLAVYEQFAPAGQNSIGISELVIDNASKKPVIHTEIAGRIRPRCVQVGHYLCVFSLAISGGTPGSVAVEVYDANSISSLSNGYILTGGGVVNASSLLEVIDRSSTVCTVAYTDTTGVVRAIDFTPSTAVITLYTFKTNAGATFPATTAMGWVQDFGASGKLSLVTADQTNGVVVHWGFGTISGGFSTATADYTIDNFFSGTGTPTQFTTGPWSVAAYTTSASTTGEFVVLYDVLTPNDTAKSVVYRGSRVGSTLNSGNEYWYGTSLASKFYQPNDGGTYILTAFSNTANPTTPQNTYFATLDGIPQPVPQATIAPQAAGGISARPSALPSVVIDPSTGNRLAAIPSLADLQYVGGTPYQLFGLQLLEVSPLGQQDTTTSPAIEAYGSLLVPGSTLMAYDGRTYAEAVFSIRPEPPILIPTNTPGAAPITIAHNNSDLVYGATSQPLAATQYDVVMGAAQSIGHSTGDNVQVLGGVATYLFIFGTNVGDLQTFDDRSLNEVLGGGTITVASSGTAGNNGTFTINSVRLISPGLIAFDVTATTQSNATVNPGTTVSVVSPNPGRFFYSAPGVPIETNDPTYKNQLMVIRGSPGATRNVGTFVLDGTNPTGSATLAGHPYFFLYSSAAAASARFDEIWTTPPVVSLQLVDPSKANTWTITNATFDQTYVGSLFTAVNTVNPSNSLTVRILQVIDGTHIVTSPPLTGGILRNEDLGHTAGVSYTVTPAVNLGIGNHSYVALYSYLDANGRKWRSPPSLPANTTTSVDFPSVTAVVQNLHQTGRACMVELYRAQTGEGGQYNLVASQANDPTQPGTVFGDTFTDGQIAEQEELFSDGGILPGTPLPGVSLIASHQGRIFVVSPENPQSLFYSNPDDSGSSGGGDGLLFDTTNLSLDIIDTHGPITAIQPMDNTLVVFKADAVYAVTGSGPDGSGQNGGYSARLIASGVGCSNPKSIALQVGSGGQADGVWFQSNSQRAGIFTVTRGLTVEYTGAGVRRYTSETIVSSLVYPGLSQLRWYTLSGRTLVWDWISKIWSTNTGQPCLTTVIYQDVPTYAPSGTLNGCILQEIPGYYAEGESLTFHTYIPYHVTLTSPWLSLGQLKGYERLYRVQGIGRTVGAHTLTVNMYGDYNDANLIGTYTATFDGSTTQWDWQILPSVQKLDTVKIELIATDPNSAPSGTAGFACTGIVVTVGIKKGTNKLADTATMAGG